MVVAACQVDGIRFTHKITTDGVNVRPQSREKWKLILLKRGKITYMIQGKLYYPAENSLIITRPGSYHSVSADPGPVYERYIMEFNEDLMLSDICTRFPEGVDVISCSGNKWIEGLFKKLDTYEKMFDEVLMKAMMIHLAEEILCHAMIAAGEADKTHTENPVVTGAVRYIGDHITHPICVEEVAERFYISRGYLYELFEKHLKTTPKKYIISQKLNLARQKLCDGVRATEVWEDCGFADYTSFYRHYVKCYGHKPSEAASRRDRFDDAY